MRRGFTLIEVLIAIGIFSIVAVVGTNLLLDVFTSANRITIQNEVRQNGSIILQDMVRSIRQSQCVTKVNDYTFNTYSDINCSVQTANYTVDEQGRLLKNTNQELTSEKVRACANSDDLCTTSECYSPGLRIEVSDSNSVNLTLIVQQTPRENLRSDACARLTLTDSATPRQY